MELRETLDLCGDIIESEDSDEVVIRGVKFLGTRSANQNPDGTHNFYGIAVRRESLALYEGAKVYLNHPARERPDAERGYEEQVGRLRSCEARRNGSYGDLHLNPHHPAAKQIIWDAKNSPDSLGLSHNALGSGRVDGKKLVIESISQVRSVDLVAAAATASSLFESLQGADVMPETETAAPAELRETLQEANTAHQAQLAELREERDALLARVDALEAAQAAQAHRDAVAALLEAAQLPAGARTEPFLEQLHRADVETAGALIEDRKQLWFSRAPVSAAPASLEEQNNITADAFLRRLG